MAKLVPFLLIAAAAFAADTSSVTGEWQVHRSAAGNESDQTCNLVQKEQELSGTCGLERGSATVAGKVDGKNVTWTYKMERDGSPITVVYKGIVDSATKMSGTVTAVEFAIDGEFTATRSK